MIVTWRCRESRRMSDGASPRVKVATFSSATLPSRVEGTGSPPSAASDVRSSASARTWTSYCSPASL